jgi:hypothetical protein
MDRTESDKSAEKSLIDGRSFSFSEKRRSLLKSNWEDFAG